MTEPPSRIQGGVFIWTCALFAVSSAIAVVFRSYEGFWEFFATCLLAAGIACSAYYLVKMLICKRAGSLDGERGPLVGLVSMGVSVFVIGYYTQLRAHPDQPPYVWAFFAWGVGALAMTGLLLLVGRGLNLYDHGLRREGVLAEWNGMTDQAQTAVLVMEAVPGLVAIVTVCDVLAYGMSLKVWMIVGNLFFMTGLILSLFAWCRRTVLDAAVLKLSAKAIGRFVPRTPCAIWRDSFTLQELFAALAASGVVAAFFVFCPRLLRDPVSYLSFTSAGVFVGFSVLILIWHFDRSHLADLLCGQWRKEKILLLQTGHEESVKRHRAAVRERVLDSFRANAGANWDDMTVIKGVAERIRKFLNLKFCEEGRMKYVSRCAFPDRIEVLLQVVGELFDSGFCTLPEAGGSEIYERMTNELLFAKSSEMEAGRTDGDLSAIEADAKTCFDELSAEIARSGIRPRCRLSLDFREGSRICGFEVEMDESGAATISDARAKGGAVLRKCTEDDLGKVLELELASL